MGKIFENLFKNPQSKKKQFQIYWQGDVMAIKKSNVACVHKLNISQYDSGEQCGPWAFCFYALLSKDWGHNIVFGLSVPLSAKALTLVISLEFWPY
jgi:hypothetical protein